MALDLATKKRIEDCWGAWRAAQGASCLGCGLPGHPADAAEVYLRVVRLTCRVCGHAYSFSLGRLLGGLAPEARKGSIIELPHIKARVARLDELTWALRKEIAVIAEGENPLLYLERRQYLTAMRAAVDGLEEARVVLAGVVGRMEQHMT